MPWETGEITERGLADWKEQGRRSRGQGAGASERAGREGEETSRGEHASRSVNLQ